MAPPLVRHGKLDVYLLGRLAGKIEYVSHHNLMTFHYDETYISRDDAIPLSHSLPFGQKNFDSERTTNFFSNLLPAENVRKRLGLILHLSRHNIFGFLEAIGGDCAGAVSIQPEGQRPEDGTGERLLELDENGADDILRSLPQRPLYAQGIEGYRISGAGAQSKLVARLTGGRIQLPLYGTPSTHIIKPEQKDFPESCHNEMFVMRLASALGLPTAKCGILRIKGVPYYFTERFDREIVDGFVRRLHQEDFCQILDVDPELKYECEAGPTFRSCTAAMREMNLGLRHQVNFIKRMIFNYLVGNADAHGKNSGILYRGKKAELAPIYDVACTAVYPRLAQENAMFVGGDRLMKNTTRDSFVRMAGECGADGRIVLDYLDAMAAAIVPAAKRLAEELADGGEPSPVYAEIVKVIEGQIARVAA